MADRFSEDLVPDLSTLRRSIHLDTLIQQTDLVRKIESDLEKVRQAQRTAQEAGGADAIAIEDIAPLEYAEMLRDCVITYVARANHYDSYGCPEVAQRYLTKAISITASLNSFADQLHTYCEDNFTAVCNASATLAQAGSVATNQEPAIEAANELSKGILKLLGRACSLHTLKDAASALEILQFLRRLCEQPTPTMQMALESRPWLQDRIVTLADMIETNLADYGDLVPQSEWRSGLNSRINLVNRILRNASTDGFLKKLAFLRPEHSFEARLSAARCLWSEMSEDWQETLNPRELANTIEYLGVYEGMFIVLGHRGPIQTPGSQLLANGCTDFLNNAVGVVHVNIASDRAQRDVQATLDHEISHLLLACLEWRGEHPTIEAKIISELCARLSEHGRHFDAADASRSLATIRLILERQYIPEFLISALAMAQFRYQGLKIAMSSEVGQALPPLSASTQHQSDVQELQLWKFLQEIDHSTGFPTWPKLGTAIDLMEKLTGIFGPETHLLIQRILINERSLDRFIDRAQAMVSRSSSAL